MSVDSNQPHANSDSRQPGNLEIPAEATRAVLAGVFGGIGGAAGIWLLRQVPIMDPLNGFLWLGAYVALLAIVLKN